MNEQEKFESMYSNKLKLLDSLYNDAVGTCYRCPLEESAINRCGECTKSKGIVSYDHFPCGQQYCTATGCRYVNTFICARRSIMSFIRCKNHLDEPSEFINTGFNINNIALDEDDHCIRDDVKRIMAWEFIPDYVRSATALHFGMDGHIKLGPITPRCKIILFNISNPEEAIEYLRSHIITNDK